MTVAPSLSEPDVRAWAHLYADLGLRVLPIKPGEKRPPMPAWQEAATTEPATIDSWWTQLYRGHGVGIATGRGSGVFVLDVDVADGKAGDDTLAELVAAHGPLPDTWTVITGSGGTHYYFAMPDGVEIRNDAGRRLGPGLDIRGEGGQVVAPPTVGRLQPYAWEVGPDEPLAEAPAWLVELLVDRPAEPMPVPVALSDDDSIARLYNSRTNWQQLLAADGWTLVRTMSDGEAQWTRPGKDPRDGISATTGHEGRDCLTVFTSSIPSLPEGTYSKFGYTAAMHRGGDRKGFARELRRTEGSTLTAFIPTPDGKWLEPIPLGNRAQDLPTFPRGVFPTWIEDQVDAVARELQMPRDLPACLALVCLATLAAKTTKVNVRGRWKESLNIYVAVAMPPSAGKSPAFSAMLAPVREWEALEVVNKRGPYAEANQKYRMAEKAVQKAEQSGSEAEAAAALGAFIALEPAPAAPRVTCDDITPEALATLLAEQKGRMAMLSTEGGVFDIMTGRYSDRTNLDVYLKAWGGDDITIDRVGRGNYTVKEPALTIGITVQPSVLAALAERPELAGRGVTARFMYALPPDNVGNRNFISQPDIDPEIGDIYAEQMAAFAQRVNGMGTLAVMTVAEDATKRFNTWRQAIERRRAPDQDMRALAEWSTKLESTVLRVAGLLHLVEGGSLTGQIGEVTMSKAIAVGDYWIAHAFAVHDLWDIDPVLAKARQILDWAKGRDRFTIRELYSKNRRVFPKADQTIEPLGLLVERGWVRPADGEWPPTMRRGAESPTLEVHPDLAGHVHHARTTTPENGQFDGSHARHVSHVLRDIKEDSLTLSAYEDENTPPCAHEAHGAHDFDLAATGTDDLPDIF